MNNNEICILAYFIEYIHSHELYTCAGIFNTYQLYVYTSFRQSKDYNKAPRLSALAPDQCNGRHRRLVAPPRIRFPYTDYRQLGKSLHEDKSHRVPFNIAPGMSFIIIIFLELGHEKAANEHFGVHHISVISGHVRTPPTHEENKKPNMYCILLLSDAVSVSWRSILMCNKSTSAGTSLEGTPMFAHVTLHRTFYPLGSKCPWWQDVEAAS